MITKPHLATDWKAGGEQMRLTPPKQIVFYIAVALAVIGLIVTIVQVPGLTPLAFWIVLLGFIVLAAGNTVTGM